MGYPFRSGQASCARMRSGSVGPWRGGSRGPARTRPRAPGRCRRVGARHSPRRAVVRGNGVGKNLSQMDKPFVEYLLDSSVRSLAGDMSHQSPLSRSGLTRSRPASPHLSQAHRPRAPAPGMLSTQAPTEPRTRKPVGRVRHRIRAASDTQLTWNPGVPAAENLCRFGLQGVEMIAVLADEHSVRRRRRDSRSACGCASAGRRRRRARSGRAAEAGAQRTLAAPIRDCRSSASTEEQGSRRRGARSCVSSTAGPNGLPTGAMRLREPGRDTGALRCFLQRRFWHRGRSRSPR